MYNKMQVKELVHVTQHKHMVIPNTTFILWQFINYMFRPCTRMIPGLRIKRAREDKKSVKR